MNINFNKKVYSMTDDNRAVFLPVEKDGIIYEIISADHIEGAFQCIIKTFSDDDPMSIAVNLSPDDLKSFLNIFIKDNLLKQNLTTIARKKDTGEVIGCILIEDITVDPPEDISGLPLNFMPIIALLENLGGWYFENHAVKPGEIVHVVMAGVAKEYMNKSIAFNLCMHAYNICKTLGFKAGISEVTGKKSQRVAAKLGADLLYSVKYKEFEVDGENPFNSIEDTESIQLVSLNII